MYVREKVTLLSKNILRNFAKIMLCLNDIANTDEIFKGHSKVTAFMKILHELLTVTQNLLQFHEMLELKCVCYSSPIYSQLLFTTFTK